MSDRTDKVIKEFLASLTAHDEHEQKQVGPCVYCVPCNVRLYQGKLNKEKRNAQG